MHAATLRNAGEHPQYYLIKIMFGKETIIYIINALGYDNISLVSHPNFYVKIRCDVHFLFCVFVFHILHFKIPNLKRI